MRHQFGNTRQSLCNRRMCFRTASTGIFVAHASLYRMCYCFVGTLRCHDTQESFRSVKSWIDDLRKLADPAVIVVVGNKCDLANSREIVQAG